MKLLIIGGDSYVGSWVAREWQDRCEVRKISRRATGHTREIVLEDLWEIPSQGFEGIDVVLNCAAIVHREESLDEGVYFRVNRDLAERNAAKARVAGVRAFLQMSTTDVYGDIPSIDTRSPENPETVYGKSKLEADRRLMEMAESFFRVLLFRPPLIYGPCAPGNMTKLIEWLNGKWPVLPFGGIQNSRDFVFIGNFSAFAWRTLQEEGGSGPLLVSDGHALSTTDLVEKLCRCLGKKKLLVRLPAWAVGLGKRVRPREFTKLFDSQVIDCETTFQTIGFRPPYMIDDAVTRTVAPFVEATKDHY